MFFMAKTTRACELVSCDFHMNNEFKSHHLIHMWTILFKSQSFVLDFVVLFLCFLKIQ